MTTTTSHSPALISISIRQRTEDSSIEWPLKRRKPRRNATGTTIENAPTSITNTPHNNHWLSGYNHHTCGRRPEVRIPGCPSSVLCEFTGTVEMAYWLCSPHLWQGGLGFESQTNNSRVLSPPASYMGLACQDGYIALRCKNFELYDNLRKKKN
jgi:hypothetical protein